MRRPKMTFFGLGRMGTGKPGLCRGQLGGFLTVAVAPGPPDGYYFIKG